jgi:hypothetical protein
MATGTNVPASSSASNNLAVRRYMAGFGGLGSAALDRTSRHKDMGHKAGAQVFAGYGSFVIPAPT